MARKKRPSRKRKAAPEPTFDSDLTIWEQIVPPEIPVRYRKQDAPTPPKPSKEQLLDRLFATDDHEERWELHRQIKEMEPWRK